MTALSLAMAERISQRPEHTSPVTPAEELEILTDWLDGLSRQKVSEKHHRGLDMVRKIIRKYQEEAREVLLVDRKGDHRHVDGDSAYDQPNGPVDAVDHSGKSFPQRR